MAVQWNNLLKTEFTAETWEESISYLKVTNVLGLAWNYYIMYTKFITGIDLTLDAGLKCEIFFADTFKIGYAVENNIHTAANRANEIKNTFTGRFFHAVGSLFTTTETETVVAVQRTESIAEEVRDIGTSDEVLLERNLSVGSEIADIGNRVTTVLSDSIEAEEVFYDCATFDVNGELEVV